MSLYIIPNPRNFLSLTGGTVSGDTYFSESLSADTIFSGSTNLEQVIYNISSVYSGASVFIQPGLNTYTGGTLNNPNVNISALTIDFLIVSGNSNFNTLFSTRLSGGTIFSGNTNIENIFSNSGHTHELSSILNTAHTHSLSEVVNLSNLLNTKVNKSGDTITGEIIVSSLSAVSLSGGSIFSGNTNLNNIFSLTGHTHQFSSILNTAHTHSLSEVDNLSNLLNTKVNKSGDTMTGGLITTSLSATTLSGGSIFSGSTNLNDIFSLTGHTHQFSTILNTAHTHSVSGIENLSNLLSTKLNKSGDTMTGGLITTSLSATTLSGGSIFSGNTNLNNIFSSTGHTHQFSTILNTAHTHSISEIDNISNLLNTKVNKSGDTMTGGLFTVGLTANTIQSNSLSGNVTQMVIADTNGNLSTQAIPSAGQSTFIRNGLNTYTGGSAFDYTINVSALTIDALIVSGNSIFTGTLSGGSSFSANTIFSGNTNLSNIFSSTGHTHQFSTILNTAHTHSIVDIDNIVNLFNTKTNRSGDTMTGGLISPSVSASTISGGTIYSGSTNLYQIFSNTGHTHEFSSIVNTGHTHSVNDISNLNDILNTKINRSGDTISGQLNLGSLSSNTISATTYYSGSTLLENVFLNIIDNNAIHSLVSNETIVPKQNNVVVLGGTVVRSFVGGGYNHLIVGGSFNFIGNGNQTKSLGGSYNFIGNGYGNYVGNAASQYGFLGNGSVNKLYSNFSSVVNGTQNYVHLDAEFGTVVNGRQNSAHSKYGFIINGINNKVDNFSNYSFISSGKNNLINQTSLYSFILNGYGNLINSGLTNVSIINGRNITGTSSYTAYVEKLSIQSAATGGDLMLTYDSTTKNVHTKPIPIEISFGINNGINTFTGGTPNFQSVNITGLTIDNLTVSGQSIFNNSLSVLSNLSANTIFSGSTNLNDIFLNSGSTSGVGTSIFINKIGSQLVFKSLSAGTNTTLFDNGSNITINSTGTGGSFVNNGINTFTAGTPVFQSINITGLTINDLTVSGTGIFIGTLSGGSSFSANTIYSGNTNLNNIFSSTGHTHQFSSILNTAHTHSISEIDNISNLLNTKVNKSGDTINGLLIVSSISGGTLSGGSIFSGSTNLNDIFSLTSHTHELSSILNTAHTHSLSEVDNLSNLLNTKVNKSGDTMIGGLIVSSLSATTLSGGTIYSGSTNLSDLFVATGLTLGNGTSIFINKTGSQLNLKSVSAGTNVTLFDDGSNITFNTTGGGSSTVNNGLNTYTAGTSTLQSVNISAATLDNLIVSGDSTFSSIDANFISGGTYYGNAANLTGITSSFGFSVDGSGIVITPGVKSYLICPNNKIITGWRLLSDVSGSCAIDIWKNTIIPTSADTITGIQIPGLLNQQINYDNDVSSWNTILLENDILGFNIISATTITKLTLTVKTINF